MKIKKKELKEIIDSLMNLLDDEIELSKDYYWEIDRDEVFENYEKPKDLTYGQISDDIEFLKSSFKGDYQLLNDFKKLSSILYLIGVQDSLSKKA